MSTWFRCGSGYSTNKRRTDKRSGVTDIFAAAFQLTDQSQAAQSSSEFSGNRSSTKSENVDRDCLSGKQRMACCARRPARLVLKMHFPSRKIKIEAKRSAVSLYQSFASFFTRLFIDIIMGNFRQHGKIYFTSCSSWSNFKWGREKKFTGENCFSIDIAFCGFRRNFKILEFSTFLALPPSSFGCTGEEIVNSILQFFALPNPWDALLWQQKLKVEATIKILKLWKNLISPSQWNGFSKKGKALQSMQHRVANAIKIF